MAVNIDRERAVEIFMGILLSHARNGIVKSVMELLEEGPPGRRRLEDKRIVLHYWFQKLTEEERNYIREIIKEAVDSALFSTFVILDGAGGGPPLPGELADFALYLQTYVDETTQELDSPQARIRLNPPRSTEDLHDIFQWTVDEMEKSGLS